MTALVKHRLMGPAAALVVLVIINAIANPNFLAITVRDGRLYGAPIDILRSNAPLMLVALGMTIVIATRGIDLSVGAIMAVSGAVALEFIAASGEPGAMSTVLIAVVVGVGVALVLGVWNGFLVSVMGIQPIIAPLVLMLAGRGAALLITQGKITTVNSDPLSFLSSGYALAIPFAFILAAVVVAAVSLVERRTALGVLTESVGINPEASRLAGVRSRGIIWGAYVLSGALAGLAGVIYAANTSAADANNAGVFIELYAILAVVLGGTSLMGGKFSIAGTVLGVLIIGTLNTTILFIGIPPAQAPVFFAVVVALVVVAQSPRFKTLFTRLAAQRRRPVAQAEVAK